MNYLKISLYLILSIFFSNFSVAAKNIELVYYNENPENQIWVYDEGDRWCLSFQKPIQGQMLTQSCYFKNKPLSLLFDYTKVQTSVVFLRSNPRKILLVGLGGASMAKALNFLLPEANLDIVEINYDLREVTRKYFDFDPNKNTKIYTENGVKFLHDCSKETYDIIILDIFNKDYIPPEVLQKSFVKNVYKALKKGGVVTINTFADSQVKGLEISLFKREFSNIQSIQAGGNRLITAVKGTWPSKQEIIQNSIIWKDKLEQLGIEYSQMLKLYTDK